ncbi:c-type cytochrome [Methylogaea oryzae]|uniref:Cytochrome c-551 n=2 Tax=Methylogaea oryzae TaxID=1295382 RepID=A0A8D4VN23_9GAMM|nr:c-type cytochrome [Methylogaea oryzae]BBL69574.1 hypothetical protein MoryE10_01800 [Methylogaea oryzae]
MRKLFLSALLMAGLLSSGVSLASEELAKSKNCLGCHAVDKAGIGPGFKQVAAKYAGQAGADAQLAQKIIKGGGGAWGGMAMPPNPSVSEADAKTLVHWILSLK